MNTPPSEDVVLAMVEMVVDSQAMNEAALAGDFDEVRFRAQLIVAKADAGGYVDLVLVAAHLVHTLGPAGTMPLPGYGAGMLRITNELTALG